MRFEIQGPPYQLYNGDIFDALIHIPDNSVDLLYADPPYFLSNGTFTCNSGKMVPVTKGEWDRAESFEQVHSFNVAWIEACARKLKKNGTLFVSGTRHNIYSVGFAFQTMGFKILNDIVWFKVNPPPNLSCRYFTHATEHLIWALPNKAGKHCFNYDEMKKIGDPTPGKQMLSLWRILPPRSSEKTNGKHPTQKPIALLKRIVAAASNPGDVVMDPFMGSGTTGVASLELGRKFIGIEIEREYFDLALKRIESIREE